MTRVIDVDANTPEPDRVHEAAVVLTCGGLVAFPTETVYGLGAHALDASAVARVFAAKGRPATDPVIVHLADAQELPRVAREIPALAFQLADRFWPGPLTLILQKHASVPDSVTAGLTTVGVRVPAHPVALALIRVADVPVAAPSANRFSRPSPTRAEHVLADLGDRIDVLLDAGPTTIGVESTILDLTTTPPVIRRPGGVTLEQLREFIPDVRHASDLLSADRVQLAPGQLLRHYAPRAQATLYIGEIDALAERVARDVRTSIAKGLHVGVLASEEDLMALAPRFAAVAHTGRVVSMRLGSRRDRNEAARELFTQLRALDAERVDVIYALAPAGEGIDAAIIDRLTRACEGRVIRA